MALANFTPRTPPPPPRVPAPVISPAPRGRLGSVSTLKHGCRIGIFGPGGIGKTSLAASCPGRTAFFDLDDSLATLRPENVQVAEGIATWDDLRSTLQAPIWNEIDNIVIDSATKAEELDVAHTLATVPHEKGTKINRIEDYGYGKGYQFVYETFLTLLGDLDQHIRAGRNVLLLMHDCTANVPNPGGEDWIRYEPRLQAPPSGKASIRLRAREWLDHLLFIGYDVAVDKDGKGKGYGTRTIYPCELPYCMAKSRRLDAPMEYIKNDTALWDALFDE